MKRLLILLCISPLFSTIGLTQVQYQVTDLGVVNTFVQATGISDSAHVVGWSSGETPGWGFLWQNGILTDLGTFGGTPTLAFDVNNSRQVAGSSTNEGLSNAFLWENGSLTNLGTLGGIVSEAFAINSPGQVVGYAHNADFLSRAFRWQGGVMTDLGTLGGDWSWATAINDSGQVVGGGAIPADNFMHPFLWQNGIMTDLGTLGGLTGEARGINNAGDVVGWAWPETVTATNAFLWRDGIMTGLANLGVSISAAEAINDVGQIVGYSQSSVGLRAVLWENDVVIDLNTRINPESGWTLTHAYDINGLGQVVGSGVLNGNTRAFLLTPEPGNVVAWSNPAGGTFGDDANWTTGASPEGEEVALFDEAYYTGASPEYGGSVPVTVAFDDIESTGGLTVGEAQIVFDVQEHSYGVNALNVHGLVESPDESQLEILNGVLGSNGTVSIGTGGQQGQLLISGGAALEVSPDEPEPQFFLIGAGGDCNGDCGRLIISAGGAVFSNGAVVGSGGQGSVFISGADSEWNDSLVVTIGESGSGFLDISGEGGFFGESLLAGQLEESSGVITIREPLSQLSAEQGMTIGFFGSATLTVSEGASASIFSRSTLGAESGGSGEVTVTGSGSTMVSEDTLFVGEFGSGGFSVFEGGDVTSDIVVMPGGNGGIGSGVVEGSGSTWDIVGDLWIGQRGIGFVRVINSGTLRASTLQIGPLGSIDSTGTVIIGGGFFQPDAKHPYTSGGNEVIVDTLLLSAGAQINAQSILFLDGGYLGSEEPLTFDITNSGSINPGDTLRTPGVFTVDASYTQLLEGKLFIELGGLTPGSGFDKLVVSGDVVLDGTLDISAIGDFEPQVGQSFEIINAGSISGSFAEVITHGGLEVALSYSPTTVTATVTTPLSIEENQGGGVPPSVFVLEQNYPNPFNPTTRISYQLATAGAVSLIVYDILGNQVKQLAVGKQRPAGHHSQVWNGTNDYGRPVASGVYLYRLMAGEFVQTRKMILMR